MSQAALSPSGTFFGHPRGLATLFFTEMWERFSYYGMRALLILFMTAAVAGDNPGMSLTDGTAAAIYGLYTSLVYLLALPGGWVADQIWGQRKTVFVGGVIIAAGHFAMAIPSTQTFFLGLILIVIGTGLLKPNVSTMVGELYPEGGATRDAGYSVYYMGINLGAFLGPLLCGYFGEQINWHFGFSLAGFGMVLGLVQYRMGGRHLGEAGLFRTSASDAEVAAKAKKFYLVSGISAAVLVLFGYLVTSGVFNLTLTDIAEALGSSILIIVALYFIYLIIFGGYDTAQKKKLGIIFWLFILAAIFWSGFEQAGSSLNLFADRMADRDFGGWELPASWLQSVNAIFIVIFAPIFGSLWLVLANMSKHPSFLTKFGLGLLGLGAGFFVIAWGAANAEPGTVGITFLIVTYFLHTVGELCLSPVGMSSITKLAPKGRVGQMMGIWFVATALGNLIAGLVAGDIGELGFGGLFQQVAWISAGAGLVALLLSKPLQKLMGQVD